MNGTTNLADKKIENRKMVVEEKNATTLPTIAPGASGHVEFPITKAGYTPIAVQSFYGSGNSGLMIVEYTMSSTMFDLVVRNITSGTVTPSWYKAKVLYEKN